MPKRFTPTFSDDLYETAELLRRRRKYRSLSEYLQGLVRYDAQTQRDHHLTAEWAALSPKERDLMDAALLRQVKSGVGIRGSYLEARIEEAIKRHVEAGRTPTAKEIASELAERIVKENAEG